MVERRVLLALALLALSALACAVGYTPPEQGTAYTPQPIGANAPTPVSAGDVAEVTDVIDGDTIEVRVNGVGYRVRYIGVNTPERDEVCYREARDLNAAFVQGRTVRLVADRDNTDRYGRLLRYVYVENVFVNEQLILQGVAEVVQYAPNTAFATYFIQLEQQAVAANRGCHPTGIFNDGNYER
jgi:endonuclease YncB( thermonuclease family)